MRSVSVFVAVNDGIMVDSAISIWLRRRRFAFRRGLQLATRMRSVMPVRLLGRVFPAVSARTGSVVITELVLPALAADAQRPCGGWSGDLSGDGRHFLILLRFGNGNCGNRTVRALNLFDLLNLFLVFVVAASDFRKLRRFVGDDVLGAIATIFAAGHDTLLEKTWERIFAPYTKWRPIVRVAGGAGWSMDRETTGAIQENTPGSHPRDLPAIG